jgi:hypothetical protein
MAIHITEPRLKLAADRLKDSRASMGFINFLILRRALEIKNGKPVDLSLKDDALQTAISEFMLWANENDSSVQKPFVNVFGTARASDLGFRVRKFRSNGVADTLKNGVWAQVIALSDGTSAQAASLKKGYESDLPARTLIQDQSRPLPRLDDSAVWFFRTADVEKIVKGKTAKQALAFLIAEFGGQTGLTPSDIKILFDATPLPNDIPIEFVLNRPADLAAIVSSSQQAVAPVGSTQRPFPQRWAVVKLSS